MKLSHGLKMMLTPIADYINVNLCDAIRKVGKRGKNGTYYPTDLKRVNLILETTSEVTGKHFEIVVKDGNIQRALDVLSIMLCHERFFQTMEALTV